MAYVGTAQDVGDPITTLASIIEGEAGNQGPVGMQAVANVIANRAAQNFGKYGTDLVNQATAKNQFQGQAKPSATALLTAANLLSGNLDDITGGATSYANPSASSAPWAKNLNENNSLKIGDHYFTDNQNGDPFVGKHSTGMQSTYDKVSGQLAAQVPVSNIANALNAYMSGQMPTDARQSFEQQVNDGSIVLPSNIKIGGQASPNAQHDTAMEMPQSAVDAYNNGTMPEDAKRSIEGLLADGSLKLPSGAALDLANTKTYSGGILPLTRYADGHVAFDPNAGLAGAVKSAVTLPGDVATGKVDPLSQEGIQRSFDLAGMVGGHASEAPVLPAAAGSAAAKGLAEAPIGEVATSVGKPSETATSPVAGMVNPNTGRAVPPLPASLTPVSTLPVAKVMTAADVAKDAAQGDAAIAGAEKSGTLPDGSKPPIEPPAVNVAATQAATKEATEGVAAAMGDASRSKTGATDLADIVKANPEIVEAANALGIGQHMEPGFVSDNTAFREIEQGMKSIPGNAGKAQQVANLEAIANKAHDVATDLQGTTDVSQLSNDVRNNMATTHADLLAKENAAYKQVRDALPAQTPAAAPDVLSFINQRAEDLGGAEHLTPMEKTILKRLSPSEESTSYIEPEAPTPDPNTGTITAAQARQYLQAKQAATEAAAQTTEKQPTYALLDDTRKMIGRGLNNEGLFKDEDIGLKKQLYSRITADQGAVSAANGVGDAWNAAKRITVGRKILERQVTALFGRQLEKDTFTGNLQAKMQTATNALAKGDAGQFAKFIASVPTEMRQRVAATALYSTLTKGMRNGRINFGNFSKWYENLANNKQSYNAIMSNLPTGAPTQIHNLYLVAKGIQRAGESAITTGRIVALGPQFQGADTLMSRLYGAAGQAATHAGKHAAAELVGHAIGVPGAGVVTAVGSALFKGAKPDAIKAVDTLLASPEFRQAVMTNATGDTKQASAVLAQSKPFSKFISSVGKDAKITNRERWIAQALTTNNNNENN